MMRNMKASMMMPSRMKALKNRKGKDFYGKKNSHETMCGLQRNEKQEGNDAGVKNRRRPYYTGYNW